MLTPETPFPYPGSYALHTDLDLAPPQPTELVRIQWRRVDSEGRGFVAVSFPLRDGASGNKVVPADALIDATELAPEEQREFHILDRELIARGIVAAVGGDAPRKRLTARQKNLLARRDALKERMIWSRFIAPKLREMRARDAMKRKAA